jgi:hypothetical protein
VRIEALRLMADVGTPADLPLLTTLADQTGPSRDLGSIAAAAALRVDMAGGMRIVEAHGGDRGWVDAVGYAFREFGSRAEPLALAMLKSGQANVRRAALTSLHELGTPASVEAIRKAEPSETDKDCRTRYQWAIKAINERAAKTD